MYIIMNFLHLTLFNNLVGLIVEEMLILSHFSLFRCTVKSEEDYRPMFENFVQDLLSTVNKPEWPSSELLLSLLGKILVRTKYVSDENCYTHFSVNISLLVECTSFKKVLLWFYRWNSSAINQWTCPSEWPPLTIWELWLQD